MAEAAPREVPQAAPPVPPTAGASATAAAINLEAVLRAEFARRACAASDLLTCRHETRPIRSGEFFFIIRFGMHRFTGFGISVDTPNQAF